MLKWGMRILGCLDLITFLIFISPKSLYFFSTFKNLFSIPQKAEAFTEVIILLLFALAGYLLFTHQKSGFILSFVLVPFRFVYLYFSFDFLSYLAYGLGFKTFVSSAVFQTQWFYYLLFTETIRYIFSCFWYYRLAKQ